MTTLIKYSYSLDGIWQFRRFVSELWLKGYVPGGVHTDLLATGHIADPFVGDEEKLVQWVAQQDWEYKRVFTVDAQLLTHDRVFLYCAGLDTLADVEINSQPVGSAANMFRAYCWEVGGLLHEGENEVRILFHSPVHYAQSHHATYPLPEVNNALSGAPYIRKAPSHFGWDWGPKIPAVGIWRTIGLEGYDAARLADIHR